MNSKRKNIILLAATIIVLVLCYQLAIKKTLDYKTRYIALKAEERLFDDIPKQFGVLNEKNKYYDSLLNTYQIGETSIQNNLLKTINKIAKEEQLKIIDFNEPHVFTKDKSKQNTYTFVVEGDFENILGLIYYLEQHTKFGEVLNVHFEKKKQLRTRKEYLQTTVMIVNYN